MREKYRPGLEVFLDSYIDLVKGKKTGLLTNHTGLNREFVQNIDLFKVHGEVNLTALFAPEHGIRGNFAAGEKVVDNFDTQTGLPVFSLYGNKREPAGKILKELDALIFDLQDVGVRFYTYLSTLINTLKVCGEAKLELIILDRPNPLGRKEEGNLLRENFKSFVGAWPVLLRHGLTLGEIALMVNSKLKDPAPLYVVPCQGWKGEFFRGAEGKWVPPSPGLPHFGSVLVYPGTCLFEGTNLSEGRGTTNPFELVGAPWVDPYRWKEELEKEKIPGVEFRPAFFRPGFSLYAGKECGGLHVYITEPEKVDTVLLGLTMLFTCRNIYPEKLKWIAGEKGYFLDQLLGDDEPRLMLEKGANPREINSNWAEERVEFGEMKKDFLLYPVEKESH